MPDSQFLQGVRDEWRTKTGGKGYNELARFLEEAFGPENLKRTWDFVRGAPEAVRTTLRKAGNATMEMLDPDFWRATVGDTAASDRLERRWRPQSNITEMLKPYTYKRPRMSMDEFVKALLEAYR